MAARVKAYCTFIYYRYCTRATRLMADPRPPDGTGGTCRSGGHCAKYREESRISEYFAGSIRCKSAEIGNEGPAAG